jgi:excinuclease ABC subunit A
VDRLLALPERTRLYLYAPLVRGRKGEHRAELERLRQAMDDRIREDQDRAAAAKRRAAPPRSRK